MSCCIHALFVPVLTVLLMTAYGDTASSPLFSSDFESGRTVVFEAVRSGTRRIHLAPGTAVSQWPEGGGRGLIEGNIPERAEEFSYRRRRGEVLHGVKGITRAHPRYCPVQTSTLEEWDKINHTREKLDFISLRRAAPRTGGYSACISMASSSRTSLEHYTTPAPRRCVRFAFLCDRELVESASGLHIRLFEIDHDFYSLPAIRIMKSKGARSARIGLVAHESRRLHGFAGPGSDAYAVVEPDTFYSVEYWYRFLAGDTAHLSLRVNGLLLDSALFVFAAKQKTPRYHYRIGKLSEVSLRGALYLDDILETPRPPVLPPPVPRLEKADGSFFIVNASSHACEAQWQLSGQNAWVAPYFSTSPRADLYPALCIPHAARFHLYNSFLAVPAYGNARCTASSFGEPTAFVNPVEHPDDSVLFARVRLRNRGKGGWSGWSAPRAFQIKTLDSPGVDPGTSSGLSVTRLRAGAGIPAVDAMPRVRRGHDFKLEIATAHRDPQSRIHSADIWLSSVQSDAAGGYANRGGAYDSTTNYVLSVAFHNRSLWARQRHGSLLFSPLDDTSETYLDATHSRVDSDNARARLVMRLPDHVRPGLWTVSAFARDQNAFCSPIVTETFLVEDAAPFAFLPLVAIAFIVAAVAASVLWVLRGKHAGSRQVDRSYPPDTPSLNKQDPGASPSSPHHGKIENARSFIRKNFTEDISPRDVARECNISADWLGKVFKKNTGMTVVQYITHVRLEQACTLLRQSDKNVSEIAYDVGYKNPNYFSKAFAKHTGLSPRDFRKEHCRR